MRTKTLIIIIGSVGVLTLLSLISTYRLNSAQSPAVNDFGTIEWVDLGEQALYPGALGISEGQSVVLNDKLYVFGGYAQCCIPIRDSYVFDPAKNQWTRLADLPLGTTHTGIATDGTDIYLAGGYVENADQSYRLVGHEKVWRYNVALDTYTALPNLPKKASTGQLAYLKGKLHYIGGTTPETQSADLPDHFVFDLQAYQTDPNTQWVDITTVAPLPNPRQHAGIAVIGGAIYYVGGQHFHNNSLVPQNDVHRYDPVSNIWTQMADMPAARNHMSNTIAVYKGNIIVMGGQLTHETPQAEVFAFDPAANTWRQLTSLPKAQFSAIGGVINGEFYFGTGDKGYFDNERRRMRKGIIDLDTSLETPTPEVSETPIAGVELLIDGDFEANDSNGDKLPDAWRVKLSSDDRLKCNRPDRIFSRTGDCAFMFKGSASENSKLQQNIDLSAYGFVQGDTLQLRAYVDANKSAVSGGMQVILKFSDGTGKIKQGVDLIQTNSYQSFTSSIVLPSANITLLRVQAHHKSLEGKVLIDDISLKWDSSS